LRVTINRITPQGQEVIRNIMGITNALRREALGNIDADELSTTGKVLAHMLRRLEALDHEGDARARDPA